MMKIFDRKFLQYQLASLKHNKYKNRILYPNIFLIAIAIYNRGNILVLLLFAAAIASLIGYGFYRFDRETSLSKEDFEKVMKKKYKEYKRDSKKINAGPGNILQKIAFEAELDMISTDEAIDQIEQLIKDKPEVKKYANNIILSLYAYKVKDKSKIPREYMDYLERTVKNEVNVNFLSDSIKTCIIIEDYDKVLSIVSRAEQELGKIKKIRKPAYNAIYRTMLVSLPFYKAEAYTALGNKKKAKESYEESLKNCKSKRFQNIIIDAMEK